MSGPPRWGSVDPRAGLEYPGGVAGSLFVVSTPIGHLEDVSARAQRVLSEVDEILCEDTRVTRRLLDALGVRTPTRSHHAHSSARAVERALERLSEGACLALVSDAGTPLVSDPGAELVARAIDRGVEVVPIPGPSAVLAALVGSGLPTQPFVFLGFLPRGAAEQRETIAPFAGLATLVVYEAPSRVGSTLRRLADACGPDRRACVARELTKRFETFARGTLAELAERFEDGSRGETVIVVGPPGDARTEAPASAADLRAEAGRLLAAGTPPSEAAKLLAASFGLKKRAAYRAVLEVSGAGAPSGADEPPSEG